MTENTVLAAQQVTQPVDVQLKNHRLLSVVGSNDKGRVYAGYVRALRQYVLIQEYFPANISLRISPTEVTSAPGHEAAFASGKRNFMFESKLLSRFSHRGLMPVIGLIEANGTAYRVMPMRRWDSLFSLLRRSNAPTRHETGLLSLLDDLAGMFSTLHGRSCIHGWINPGNILVQPFESAVLLDLGCAGLGPGERGPTGPKPNDIQRRYAPPEALTTGAAQPLGPWTDVYCVAAVLHHWVTGQPPMPAEARLAQDTQTPLMQRLGQLRASGAHYQPATLAAIDAGLQLRPELRPRSIDQWHRMFPSDRGPAPVSRVKFIHRSGNTVVGGAASGIIMTSGGTSMGADGSPLPQVAQALQALYGANDALHEHRSQASSGQMLSALRDPHVFGAGRVATRQPSTDERNTVMRRSTSDDADIPTLTVIRRRALPARPAAPDRQEPTIVRAFRTRPRPRSAADTPTSIPPGHTATVSWLYPPGNNQQQG